MKNKTFKLIGFFLIFISSAAAQSETAEIPFKEMAVGVNGVYIASGLTLQNNAYVVVNGLFPNGCYSLLAPKIVNKDTFTHEISVMAKVTQGLCLRVLVPFNQEISVGKLAVGEHLFRFIADDGTSIEKKTTVQ